MACCASATVHSEAVPFPLKHEWPPVPASTDSEHQSSMFRPWVFWWCWTDCHIACICAGGTGTVSHTVSSAFGISVNFAETKWIVAGVGASADDKAALIVADQPVQCVSSFVYWDCAISPDNRIAGEVDRRLANAGNAFGSLLCVFRDPKLSLQV